MGRLEEIKRVESSGMGRKEGMECWLEPKGQEGCQCGNRIGLAKSLGT